MTDDNKYEHIGADVAETINAALNEDAPETLKTGGRLIVRLLCDIDRIATALERLADCEQNGMFNTFDNSRGPV